MKGLMDLSQYVTEAKEIEVYKTDVVVKRGSKVNPKRSNSHNRREIKELTNKSLKRLAFIASNSEIEFDTLITVTYPREWSKDGKQVKHDLKLFKQSLVRRFECSYLWFLEFQKRGAPHFHIITNQGTYSKDDIRWVAKRWYDIVDSGDNYHLLAGTRIEGVRDNGNLKHYVVKYACKPYQKTVPKEYRNVGRFYGYSKDVKPVCKRTVELLGDEDLYHYLGEWGYTERVRGKPIKVLYNAAKYVL